MLRLQKFLAQAGLGSRRSCEQLIKDNKVYVNGKLAVLGTKVTETDEVTFDVKINEIREPINVKFDDKFAKGLGMPGIKELKKAVGQNGTIIMPCYNIGISPEKIFNNFQVNDKLFAVAADDAIFMHCLPAHRGQEVSSEIIDGPRSVVWDEAENRLHIQKAILSWAIADKLI